LNEKQNELLSNHRQQLANGSVGLDRMAKRLSRGNPIAILSTKPFSLDKAAFFQVRNDSLHRPFRDSHSGRDITQNHRIILGQNNHYMGVIGQKCPLRGSKPFRWDQFLLLVGWRHCLGSRDCHIKTLCMHVEKWTRD